MRLICPCCGGIFSAESSSCDINARQAMRLIAEIPAPANKPVLNYIAMFRSPDPESRGLRWDKVVRLLGELIILIREPHISFDRKPARKNSATAWAQAMERMIEHPPRQLPLKTHGYLTSVAYEIANEQDRSAEVRRNQMERSGINPKSSVFPTSNDVEKEETPTIQPPSVEEMAEYARQRKFRKVKGLLTKIGTEES